MWLPSHMRFADEKLKERFKRLQDGTSEEKALAQQLATAFINIENNAFCSIQIPKRQIPNRYLSKYNIHNLWKYDLPGAWRLLYSVENQEVIIVAIIIEWMNHKEYEKKFNY